MCKRLPVSVAIGLRKNLLYEGGTSNNITGMDYYGVLNIFDMNIFLGYYIKSLNEYHDQKIAELSDST